MTPGLPTKTELLREIETAIDAYWAAQAEARRAKKRLDHLNVRFARGDYRNEGR